MRSVFLLLVLAVGGTWLIAQDAGSRREVTRMPSPNAPSAQAIDQYIEIKASAAVRVEPTEVRVVLAMSSVAQDPAALQSAQETRRSNVRDAVLGLGISQGDLHLDFVALAPIYEWRMEDHEGKPAAFERHTGWRITENLHVRLENTELLEGLRTQALSAGASDIVAVDYASPELDAAQVEALSRALRAAEEKAKLLLAPTFGESRPRIMNLREHVEVHTPGELYRSFTPADAAPTESWIPYRSEMPRFQAPRPIATYYHGFDRVVDRRDEVLPMRPAIVVDATVWLYFRADAR